MGSTPRGISGSRAAAVLGLSEFTTQFEVFQLLKEERFPGWNAAHGYVLPVFEGNAATMWGTAFEDSVVELVERERDTLIQYREREFGYAMTPDGQFIGLPELTCHIDGAYGYPESPDPADWTLHEGKTTNLRSFRDKWGEPGTDRIPQSYQIQVQHQMLVTGAREVIVSVLVFPIAPDELEKQGRTVEQVNGQWHVIGPDRRWSTPCQKWADVLADNGLFYTYTVRSNPEAQALMLARYREFWDRYIVGDEEPKPESYEDIKRAFPEPVGTVVVSPQVQAWLSEYRDISDELGGKGSLSRRKDELRTLILDDVRKADPVIDDESREKTILRDEAGKKLGQFDGRMFRVN